MARRQASEAKGPAVRIGQAAEMLGVSSDTLRRWEADGRIRTRRSAGGQRVIDLDELRRVRAGAVRRARPVVAQSARNRFAGVVTRVERDRVAAVVEVQAGPHRFVSLITAEAVAELDVRVGDEVVCVVKATSVGIERTAAARSRQGTG